MSSPNTAPGGASSNGTVRGATAAPDPSVSTRTRPWIVGFANNCSTVKCTDRFPANAWTCRLRIESPPRLKKLSCTPTRSTPSTVRHTCARPVPVPTAAPRTPPTAPARRYRHRQPARSTFPFTVNGNPGNHTNTAGTM